MLFKLQGSISGRIYCIAGKGKLTLDVDSVNVDVGVESALELSEFGSERKIVKEFEISFDEEEIKISDALLTSLARLNGKVTFVLEEET